MKFNFLKKGTDTTVNYMGAKAYTLSPEMELYTAVATCLVEDSYYEKNEGRLARIKALVAVCNPEFVARLAVYARTEMNLRSVPVLLAVELAKVHSGDALVSKVVSRVVQRADEIKEVLAYYTAANERTETKKLGKLSKQVQKGLVESFNRFDEYQFAKYNGKAAVSLKDALFLVHPKAKDEAQQAVFNKIASDMLATPYTWETELSALGQTTFQNERAKADAIAAKWEELVASGRVGYMAVLRNLRNILTKGTSAALDEALAILTDAAKIRKARQLPFRYLSAYAEVEAIAKETGIFESDLRKIAKTLVALETALVAACDNIRVADGKTAILSDNSSSMAGDFGGASATSAMSKRTTADIANLFAVLYWMKSEDAYIGLFGDRLIELELRTKGDVFGNFKTVNTAAKACGGATERGIFDYIERIIKKRTMVDRIIIFSDCQVGTGCTWYDSHGNRGDNFNRLMQQYRAINPAVKVYSVDLKGYGNTMMKDGAVLVSGWSEKLFDMIYAVEQGSSVEQIINAIEL